jgi:hypothetical protein
MVSMMDEVYPVLLAVASGTFTYHVSPLALNYACRRWRITDRAERWLIVVAVNVILATFAYALIVEIGFEIFTKDKLLQCVLLSFVASQAWWAKEVNGEPVVDKEFMQSLYEVGQEILANATRPGEYANQQYQIDAQAIDKLDKVMRGR